MTSATNAATLQNPRFLTFSNNKPTPDFETRGWGPGLDFFDRHTFTTCARKIVRELGKSRPQRNFRINFIAPDADLQRAI